MIAETIERVTTRSTPTHPYLIRKAGVLGAGNMGSRIAAHFANAGVPVVLLDIVPPNAPAGNKVARNGVVSAALEGLKKSKPAAFFDPVNIRLIQIGNFEDDLELLRDCDWIIEVVAENLEIKRALLAKVNQFRRADTIITTNTSGLPVSQIAENLDAGFKKHWFGTHFFNPPRYMRLLEVIPTPESDPAAIQAIEQFVDRRLGKTVVTAKDTPNFIANRIGTFAMMNALRVMQAMDMSIEEVDALTGATLGWPKSGTFRLSDMVGIDVLAHVARNFFERVKDERPDVEPPPFLAQMLERKWLGDKAGQGFYKKTRGAGGEEQRLGLDWKTLEYRPSERVKFPSLELAKNADSLADRLKMVLANDPKKDRAAAFYWQVLPELWNYAANRVPEISDDIVGIDEAMKNGFNWEMGPFEMWDAVGVAATAEKMKASGMMLAPAVEKLLKSGRSSWYQNDASVPSGRRFFDISTATYQPVPAVSGVSTVQILKQAHAVVKKNAGASLIDLGDGVACIEFHSKMNAIGGDIVSLITQTLKPGSEALNQFDAFVISNDSDNFSVGANVMQLLLGIQEQDWDELDIAIRAFQKMTQTIKFCPKPVVAAPFGMCLGGGCEISLHAAARQPHAELYMGLVETGVGLVPGGGGCKEMALRAIDTAAALREGGRNESVELIETMRRAFENIAMAKVSASAVEARGMGYLSPADVITMNRERVLLDAKERARELADAGYSAPTPRKDIPAPGENMLATQKMFIRLMREGEFISDHDVKVANHVANILCGGKVTPGTLVSEQYFLDLERQSFLSLCGEKKTAERIAHTLKTGKPLRN
jgi:3-hydroxyacyl-CoA dehydrogenase